MTLATLLVSRKRMTKRHSLKTKPMGFRTRSASVVTSEHAEITQRIQVRTLPMFVCAGGANLHIIASPLEDFRFRCFFPHRSAPMF